MDSQTSLRARIGIDVAPTTLGTYVYTHRSLGKFIKKKFRSKDVAFGQLNEQFIREYQDFALGELGYSLDTVRHYLVILKKICKIAFREGLSEKLHFAHYKLPKQKETTPKALSRESFEKIRDLDIPPPTDLQPVSHGTCSFLPATRAQPTPM